MLSLSVLGVLLREFTFSDYTGSTAESIYFSTGSARSIMMRSTNGLRTATDASILQTQNHKILQTLGAFEVSDPEIP